MSAISNQNLERLKLSVLDTRENLLDFMTMVSLETDNAGWLDIQIEPASPGGNSRSANAVPNAAHR